MSTIALPTPTIPTTTGTPALTYPERTLLAGDLDAGLIVGYTAGNVNGPARKWITRARAAYAAFRKPHGYAGAAAMLTLPSAQAKLGKSERYALGLMLTPANTLDTAQFLPGSRPVNVCPMASKGCAAACLSQSGHGQFDATQRARQVRHAFLLADPFHAGVLIGAEIARAVRKYGADGITFRFNVVSDYRLEFLAPQFLARMEADGVPVYDYTAWKPSDRSPGQHYHLTYSAKETAHTSDAYLRDVLLSGENVAMPFHVASGDELPDTYVLAGVRFGVIDGDATDDRTTDPYRARIVYAHPNSGTIPTGRVYDVGVIVGLSAKGPKGKRDTSGFIRQP
jgi:hypothetical protein